MRFILPSCFGLAALCAPVSAGFTSSAVIDDFSSPAGPAGLGFNRTLLSGAQVGFGFCLLSNNAGLQYITNSPGFNASAYNGFSLKVNGSLGTGGLFLDVIGDGSAFVALAVDFGSTINNGYAWITFDQLDAAVGNDPGTIASSLSSGFGFVGIGIYTTGDAAITVDNFEFRSLAVPAPGAIALAAAAGLAATRRRR